MGGAVVPALCAAGHQVRAGMRRPDDRFARCVDAVDAVAFDLDDDASIAAAVADVDAVVFLVHGLDRHGFADWEVSTATRFATACRAAGVKRLVYLGGVVSTLRTPTGRVPSAPSAHLASRGATGRALSQAAPSTLELKAGVVVGAGGASFRLLRDVAVRAPFMVPAPFLAAQQQPIAIDDVVAAIVHAVSVADGSLNGSLDLPGPTTLASEAFLRLVCELCGVRARFVPVALPVDVIVMGLTQLTRADPAVVRALFSGADGADYVAVDVDGDNGDGLYARAPHLLRTPLRLAVQRALLHEAQRRDARAVVVDAVLGRLFAGRA